METKTAFKKFKKSNFLVKLYKLLFIAKVELMSNKHTFSKWLSFAVAKDKVIISAPEYDLECLCTAAWTVCFKDCFIYCPVPSVFLPSGKGLWLVLSERWHWRLNKVMKVPGTQQAADLLWITSPVAARRRLWPGLRSERGLTARTAEVFHFALYILIDFDVLIDNTLFFRFIWPSQYFHWQKHKDGRH